MHPLRAISIACKRACSMENIRSISHVHSLTHCEPGLLPRRLTASGQSLCWAASPKGERIVPSTHSSLSCQPAALKPSAANGGRAPHQMGRSSRPGVLRLGRRRALELWWPACSRLVFVSVCSFEVVDDHSSVLFSAAVSWQRRQEGMCQRHWRQGDRGRGAGVGAAPLTVSDCSMGHAADSLHDTVACCVRACDCHKTTADARNGCSRQERVQMSAVLSSTILLMRQASVRTK
jgi:hypothetical protein